MTDYVISGDVLTDIADSIRARESSTDLIPPEEMGYRVLMMPGLGSIDGSFIDRSVALIKNDDVTEVGNHAFRGCENLVSVDFPKARKVGQYSFLECDNLTNVHMPLLETIGNYAFQYTKVTEAIFPLVTTIGTNAFTACEALLSVELPLVANVGGFSGCSALTRIKIESASEIRSSGFSSCTSLMNIDLPNVTKVGISAFQGCSSLSSVDFSKPVDIANRAFYMCSALNTIILRNQISVSTVGSTSLSVTPFDDGGGYIYVPKALLEDYQTAENWSTYASQFRALEDYTVDGTTTGELDENKI